MGNRVSRQTRRFRLGRKVIKPDDSSVTEEEEYVETIRDANFTWLDGRRVSEDSVYIFERYNEETDRMTHMNHQIFKYILRRNTKIPITSEMKKCLHIGSGHHIWLVEMANDYKEIHFEGFDIAVATEIDTGLTTQLPSNANFRHGNIFSEGLPYPDETFDYVNVRMFLSWLPGDKIPFVLKEVKRVTKKGCWIELLEMDIFVRNPTLLYEENLGKIWKEICKTKGYNPSNIINMDKYFDDKEFDGVNNSKLSLPIGKYGGRVGELFSKQIINGTNAIVTLIKDKLNLSHEEIQIYLSDCIKELNLNQSYSNVYLLCARKI